jgi:hypothetical protein
VEPRLDVASQQRGDVVGLRRRRRAVRRAAVRDEERERRPARAGGRLDAHARLALDGRVLEAAHDLAGQDDARGRRAQRRARAHGRAARADAAVARGHLYDGCPMAPWKGRFTSDKLTQRLPFRRGLVAMLANAVPNLEFLNIYTNSCIITYEACAALKGCRALKGLHVNGQHDGIPDDVFDDLRRSNPSLSIV